MLFEVDLETNEIVQAIIYTKAEEGVFPIPPAYNVVLPEIKVLDEDSKYYQYNPTTETVELKPDWENLKTLDIAEENTKVLNKAKDDKINSIKDASNDVVTIGEVTYNGGADSASAINGAVTLAQALGETDVKIWDVDNIVATYTFDEAMNISAQIAKAYRDSKLAKYDLVAQINACTTQEELNLIEV